MLVIANRRRRARTSIARHRSDESSRGVTRSRLGLGCENLDSKDMMAFYNRDKPTSPQPIFSGWS
jgi:hypothetical protein